MSEEMGQEFQYESSMRAGRILLVDDNHDLVDNLREILEDSGYLVDSAGTCAEAREKIGAGFDVALVDLHLPDGNGTDLVPELKAIKPGLEVVLLTGFASVESAAAAVRSGACAYLVKPCATPELLLTVGQATRQAHMHIEKRALARRAQVAEKLAAVGTLTAGLSHEIRNPLNAAGLQLSVLERRLRRLPEESQPLLLEPLTLVRDEIRRLDHLLEDFLEFARPRELLPEPVDPAHLLSRVRDLLSGEADFKKVELELVLGEVPMVSGDENRLRQVLMNLALNALDAAGEGGKVRLELRRYGKLVEILVDDSGPGIAPENRKRLFEPFFSTRSAGTGLGLPIVHAIVAQHRGSIHAEDSPFMGGARFVLRLPELLVEP